MDGWEWNKLAASVLAALVFVLAVHFAAEAIFAVPDLPKPAYVPQPPDKPLPVAPKPDEDTQPQ